MKQIGFYRIEEDWRHTAREADASYVTSLWSRSMALYCMHIKP